jgi:hypothetical protein
MQKNNDALYGLIDPYLSGQLPEAEAAAFRAAMLEDAALAQEVELRRLEFEVSEALIAQSVREQMHRLRAGPPPQGDTPQPVQKEKFRFALWVAAAMLCIAAIGVYGWFKRPAATAPAQSVPLQPPPDSVLRLPQASNEPASKPEEKAPTSSPKTAAPRHLALAAQLYRDPDFETLRGTASSADGPFESALSFWKKRDWAGVLAALSSVATDDPQFIRVQAFRGHAQFKLARYGPAAAAFKAVSDSRIQPWAEEAEWYLLLALLADGKASDPDFRARLQKLLSDASHPYLEEAERLRKALE